MQTMNSHLAGVASFGTTSITVGNSNAIEYSHDSGQTWTSAINPLNDYFNAVALGDQNTGWAVSQLGNVYKTTDAGVTWTTLTLPAFAAGKALRGICAVDANTVWVSGSGGSGATNVSLIYKSIDGGATWTQIWTTANIPSALFGLNTSGTTTFYTTLYSIFFLDANNGYVVGGLGSVPIVNGGGGKIAKTTDGGATWTVTTFASTNESFRTVSFANPLNGWVAGNTGAGLSGSCTRTTDGGITWQPMVPVTGSTTITSIFGYDANKVYACNQTNNKISKSSDGGVTWSDITVGIGFYGGFAKNGADLILVGSNGQIFKSIDFGTTWDLRSGGLAFGINDLHFIDANNGWAACATGKIMKTTNGGLNWTTVQTPNTVTTLQSVFFTDINNGFTVGTTLAGSPPAFRSTDGGNTWTVVALPSGLVSQFDVYFPSSSIGYSVGVSGSISKTIDGGATWVGQASGSTQNLQACYFLNDNLGWAVGGGSTIVKTVDGGTTWSVPGTLPWASTFIYDIWFADANVGYICGASGRAAKTVDGGATWIPLVTGILNPLNDLEFVSVDKGVFMGAVGAMVSTNDGGLTFRSHVPPYIISEFGTCVESVPGSTCPKDLFFSYSPVPTGGGSIMKSSFSTYYMDNDLDGYGGTSSMCAFAPSPGLVAQSGDCNDTNPAINPGATEICGNGVDDNCDGLTDPMLVLGPISIAETSGTPNDAIVCAGSIVVLTSPLGNTYAWSNGGSSQVITVNPTSNTTYTVTVTGAGGCTATATASITANPIPVVSTLNDIVTCAGSLIPVVSFSSNVPGASFTWSNSNPAIGLAASGNGNLPAFTSINSGLNPITATITVTPSAAGCVGAAVSFLITVNPKPTISAALTQPTTCVSTNGQINQTITGPSGPYSFNWTASLGAGIVVGQEDQLALTYGNYSVSVSAANTCTNTANYSLVGPGNCAICPTFGALTSTPTTVACAGDAFQLNQAGLTNMANSYGVQFKYSLTALANPYVGGTVLTTVSNGSLTSAGTIANATGLTIGASGTYFVYAILSPTPVDPNCRPSANLSLVINAYPNVFAVTGGGSFCSGGNGLLIGLSGSELNTNYQLKLGTANIGAPVVGTGSAISFGAQSGVGTYTVVATKTNGGNCSIIMPTNAVITSFNCGASITDPCTCKDNATTLINGQFGETITVNAPAGQTWTVSAISGLFSSASAAPPVAPTPIAIGTPLIASGTTYTLSGIHVDAIGYTVSVTNGLGTTLSIGNTCAYPNPVLNLDNSTNYCAGSPVVTLTGTPGDANIVSQSFTINGVAATQFNPAALGAGNHTVTYIVNGGLPKAAGPNDPGCTQRVSKIVTVVTSSASVTCRNLVNVSLDNTCTAVIGPDEILSGTYSCYDDYTVKITGLSGTPNYGNTVNSTHVGKFWRATVTHTPSGNSCWGNIFVEDKLAPVINCQDITVSCATPLANAGGTPTVVENCGTYSLTFGDVETVDVACGQAINGQAGMSYAVKRIWTATDNSGNFTTCQQWIYFRRVTIPQVLPPADVTVNCTNPNTSPLITGAPYVLVGGNQVRLFPNNTYCELNVGYADERIDVCDGTYKILRTWTVIDWCSPTAINVNPMYYIQLIKVLDDGAPVVDCPIDMTVSVDPQGCTSNFNLPDVLVTDACSRLASIKATYTVNGVVRTINGNFSNFPGNNLWNPDTLGVLGFASNLPLGPTTFNYTVTDDCGNSTTCQFKVTVADLIPPDAVCDLHTIVSIGQGSVVNGQQGMVLVNASTFDDGSYDNCGPVYFKARRMDSNGCQTNSQFHDQVKFCCSDIGQTIMVVFRVYDVDPGTGSVSESFLEDHANDCMVEVEVADKIKPSCSAPANVTVSCENFDPSLWAFGTATADDNCCLDATKSYNGSIGITHSANYSQFDTVCNRGVITRTFRAYDCAGLSSVCTQRVTVTYNQDYFLHLPADRIVYDCDITGNYGEPVIFDEDCELVGTSFTDELITVVPDACYKIIRTWRISNWCTYNPDLPCVQIPNPNPNAIVNHPSNLNAPFLKVTPYSAGDLSVPVDFRSTLVSITPGAPQTDYTSFYQANANCYEYSQIIKIIDNVAPVISNCPASPVAFGDVTPNNPLLWNNSLYNDPLHNIHDLCEMPVDLSINASDLCAGTNLNVRYLLFLDTDNSGDMETVVNSNNLPSTYGTIAIGNAANPNYTGGTVLPFDNGYKTGGLRRFALQQTVANGVRTARVAWNTLNAPTTYDTPELPHGTHKIKWLVQDGCGNEATCEYTFTIRDTKAPTVVCLNGISVNIMPTGMIDIWDTELLQYTVDNCTPTPQLKTAICKTCTSFPLDANGNPIKFVTFTCAELGTQTVRIWSIDKSGNADFCETYVLVQDNAGNCGSGNKMVAGDLKGMDKNNVAQGLEDADVQLNGSHPAIPNINLNAVTNVGGHFQISNAVPVGANFTVTPVKDGNYLNGVDMLDVLKIQRHILGLEPLTSPYRMIAADVNNTGSITSSDIVELRKLILGAYTALPNVASYRFVDKSYVFPNPNNPFVPAFPEMISVAQIQNDKMDANFEAAKMGDVTGNATFNTIMSSDDRTNGTLLFDIADRKVAKGEEFTVDFTAAERVLGYQFTMNTKGLNIVDVVPGAGMDMNNFAVFVQRGAMTTVVEDAAAKASFSVKFVATEAGELSKMLSVSSAITKAVAYTNETERYDVGFRFNGQGGTVISGVGFELYQNQPNPFINTTVVGFHLPEAASATMTVYDELGRTLFTQKGDFGKGYNAISIDRSQLKAKGVLFYTLESTGFSATKEMIQAD